MKIAVPTEIKNNEFRVAITPSGVHDLVTNGHEVLVQSGATSAEEFCAHPDYANKYLLGSALVYVGERVVFEWDQVLCVEML